MPIIAQEMGEVVREHSLSRLMVGLVLCDHSRSTMPLRKSAALPDEYWQMTNSK
jgi:hypothetical protein